MALAAPILDADEIKKTFDGSDSVSFSMYEINEEAATLIAELLKNNPQITKFNITSSTIQPQNLKILLSGLGPNITDVDFNGTTLGNEGLLYLVETLKQYKQINLLWILETRFNDDAILHLADLLSNVQIVDLDISSNEYSSQSWALLANSLKSQNSLESLNLSQTNLDDSNLQSLTEALRLNQGLSFLDLFGNKITDSGAQILSDYVKTGANNLNSLSLQRNQIGDEGSKLIFMAALENENVNFCFLNDNPITEEGKNYIQLKKPKRLEFFN